MPPKFDEKTNKLGINLIEATLHELEFLTEINNTPSLQDADVLSYAVYRYENYWLPLIAEHPKECFAAPLDIEWVWHCHLLSPVAYIEDCLQLLGAVPDHKLYSRNGRQVPLHRSREYWMKKYCKGGEPFDFNFDNPQLGHGGLPSSKLSYDIVGSALRQSVFFYQVSLSHYKDTDFLQNGLLRYKKYLFLKQQNPKEFLVPCYDMDVIWHSHQLHPILYKTDTEKIIGKILNHDDSVNERHPGSKLNTSDLSTRQMWKKTFEENFSMYGAMFRGNPPKGKLHPFGDQETWTYATKQVEVTVENIRLRFSQPPIHNRLKLKIFRSAQGKDENVALRVQTTSKEVSANNGIDWSREQLEHKGCFTFDNRHHNNLKFTLTERSGYCCLKSKATMGEYTYNLLPDIERHPRGCPLRISGQLGTWAEVELIGKLSTPLKGPMLFSLEHGKYEKAVMPEKIEQLWGPIPLAYLPPGQDNRCLVASHRIDAPYINRTPYHFGERINYATHSGYGSSVFCATRRSCCHLEHSTAKLQVKQKLQIR